MATVKKTKKYEGGGPIKAAAAALDKASVLGKNYKPATAAEKAQAAKQVADMKAKAAAGKPFKSGGKMKKAKAGGSFPDLNKDGKITKADILKGRGVIAKSGKKVTKGCMSCGGKMKKK